MSLRTLAVDIAFNSPVNDLMAVDSAVDDIKGSAVDATGGVSELGNVSGKVSGSMLDGFKKAGESMQGLGTKMSLGITAPLVALGTAAIHTVSKFDDSMSKVQAISGATSEEFGKLRDFAIELGSTTAHSASAAADGMTIFATAGWDTNQILEGTPNLLNLASASGLELADAAGIMTNTMGQFSLEAEESGRIADAFAVASTSSETNVAELGEAMKYAGGVAASMNMDMEKTNATLGIFAGAGLVGSAAGTAFTAMFNDLSKGAEDGAIEIGKASVAVYDATGTMRDMGSIMADVEKATSGMNDVTKDAALQNVFGTQAMRGVTAMLTEGSESYKELEDAIYDSSGAAAEMSDVMEDNLAGAFRGMGSALEGFMIQIGDQLKPIVQDVAEFIGDIALKFGELEDNTKKNIVVFGGILAAAGPVLLVFGKMFTLITPVIGAIKGLGTGLALLTNPIGWVVIAIGLIVGAVVVAYDKVEWFRDALDSAWEWIKTSTSDAFEWILEIITNVMGSVMEFVGGILTRLTDFWSEHGEFIASLVQEKFNSIMSTIQMVMGIIQGVFEVVWPLISGVVQIAWGVIQGVVQTSIDIVLGVIGAAMNLLQGDWAGAWDSIWGIVTDIWDNILGFFAGVNLFQIGADILQGLIDGISSMASAVWSKVTDIGQGIADKFKSVLKIFSPSRLFEGFGIDTMLGYTIGFEGEAENAIDASESAAIDVADSFDVSGRSSDDPAAPEFPEIPKYPEITNDIIVPDQSNIADYPVYHPFDSEQLPEDQAPGQSTTKTENINTFEFHISGENSKDIASEVRREIEAVFTRLNAVTP